MLKINFEYQEILIGIIISTVLISFPANFVFGLKDASAVYCKEMGYEWAIKETEAGQMGVCKFSETESCPAWEFLAGKCGEKYSYCSKKGYELKTINDPEKCSNVPFSPQCAVCVLEDGSEVEVTKLMELSFEEGVCGDGKCVLGEYYETCPQDCPSGSFNRYCDGVSDGICDPDCTPETDSDCKKKLICPDGKCGEGESYRNCPEDCPSGSVDGYCDKVKDGICDSDCKANEDSDCQKEQKKQINYISYIIISFIVVLFAILIYKLIRSQTHKKEEV